MTEKQVSGADPNVRELTRREFLKLLKGLGIGLAAGTLLKSQFFAHDAPLAVFTVDLVRPRAFLDAGDFAQRNELRFSTRPGRLA